MEPSIVCPNCRTEIKLTETLAAPLIEAAKRDSEAKLRQKEAEIAKRETAIRAQAEAIKEAKDAIDAQVADKLKGERKKVAEEEQKKAAAKFSLDLHHKDQLLEEANKLATERAAKLEEAQKAQAEALRKTRELDDAKRELDLTIEKRVGEKQAEIQARAKAEAEQALGLKVLEKEQTILSMQKQIEELKRKSEQGSQQLQGEVQELQLEALLRGSVPHDTITPVPKGEFGGDTVQQVTTPYGQPCGKILWESKRTRNWSDGWLQKLRDDQRAAKAEAEQALGRKVPEKEQTILSMQKQIEELKRKSEQGSQQLQGEVQELQLEALLRGSFPHDTITPVPKGEFGGDTVQQVTTPYGQPCGKILWESKRTRNWSDGWLQKLRDDQRAAKADAAILVSQALPKTIDVFGQIDGVWIASPKCAIAVAMAIRHALIEVAMARKSGEGQQTKMEAMYHYLTGPRFRHRVEAIVEKFQDMQADLERERKAMQKSWAKREQQIQVIVQATAGMWGDMQGIAGRSLPEIEGLDFDGAEAVEDQTPAGKLRLIESDS